MRPVPDPPGPGQESVWSFPRPAIAQTVAGRIVIEHLGHVIADTRSAIRTIETSHPPTYYIPRADIADGLLRHAGGGSVCEWKGAATYWDVLVDGAVLPRVGWSYERPTAAFASIRGHVAFYAWPFDRCTVDGEVAVPQPGRFYGGWITRQFAGPFKGGPGTMGW